MGHTEAEVDEILKRHCEQKNLEYTLVYSRLIELIKTKGDEFLLTYLDPSGNLFVLGTILGDDGGNKRWFDASFRFGNRRLLEIDFRLAPLEASYPLHGHSPRETFLMDCKFVDVSGDDEREDWLMGKVDINEMKMRFRDQFGQADLRTRDVLEFTFGATPRKPVRDDYPDLDDVEMRYHFGTRPVFGQVRDQLLGAFESLGTVLG